MKKKFVATMAIVVITILSISSVVNAAPTQTKPDAINSTGKIVFDNGTIETTDDIIFDSNDLYYLYYLCQ